MRSNSTSPEYHALADWEHRHRQVMPAGGAEFHAALNGTGYTHIFGAVTSRQYRCRRLRHHLRVVFDRQTASPGRRYQGGCANSQPLTDNLFSVLADAACADTADADRRSGKPPDEKIFAKPAQRRTKLFQNRSGNDTGDNNRMVSAASSCTACHTARLPPIASSRGFARCTSRRSLRQTGKRSQSTKSNATARQISRAAFPAPTTHTNA